VDRLRTLADHASDPTQAIRKRLDVRRIVGRSSALAAMLQEVALVAPLDITVLLTGASGTGKSQIARLIHDSGPRGGRPFVELNCGALPETLVESELFGALPGAHSTATHKIPGKVAAAERGTLFLDEIGDLAPPAQSKLLQLLQTKQYHPLGAARAVQADIRVIAATNVDLHTAVAEHRFREDLLYRLQVLCIRMPSLAERREDVPLLAAFFCAEACERHRLPRLECTDGALRALEAVEWPGNVRQLANVVEVAAIRAAGDGSTWIEAAHLFPSPAKNPVDAGRQTFQTATRDFQAQFLRRALEEAGWNIAEVARRLDLARSHVYNLIRAFGLERRSG
jgi:Nif-specific regulatory protein